MAVPLLDLTRQYATIADDLEQRVLEVLRSGYYILGPNVTAFEKQAAEYVGTEYAVGLNSGTDALRISLRALGVGPGDEVITTAFSYFATCEVISELGAKPVFCDILYDSFNMDPEDLKARISSRTKAIIPVHLFGQLCDMTAIMEIAGKNNIAVVEDACQAIGATCPAGNAGSIGDTGTFSFFPSKNLGAAGDAGLLTTNDQKIAEFAVSMRMHGTVDDRYRHERLGYNSRLDAIQAVVLSVKLDHLDRFIEKRREHAATYDNAFRNIQSIEPAVEIEDFLHTYHQYTVRIKNGKRDSVFDRLRNTQIGCAIYYKVPLHRQPVYEDIYSDISLPVTEKAAEEVLSLPVFPEMTESERSEVIEKISEALN